MGTLPGPCVLADDEIGFWIVGRALSKKEGLQLGV